MKDDVYSNVRLFVLGALNEKPCYGYEIVSLGETWAIHRWAGITIGATYAALRKLEKEGWVEGAGSEREGKRPERQVWRLTNLGKDGLVKYIRQGLSSLNFESREVDVALAFAHLLPPEERVECLKKRRGPLGERLAQLEHFDRSYASAPSSSDPQLAEFKRLKRDHPWIHASVKHGVGRIRSEARWLEQLINEIEHWPTGLLFVENSK